jgi:hypothetical protein
MMLELFVEEGIGISIHHFGKNNREYWKLECTTLVG